MKLTKKNEKEDNKKLILFEKELRSSKLSEQEICEGIVFFYLGLKDNYKINKNKLIKINDSQDN